MTGLEHKEVFPGRLGVQQRVLPAYRAPFFEALAAACQGGLSVFAGQPVDEENVTPAGRLQAAQLIPARNLNILPFSSPLYQCWQLGLISWLERWQPDVLIVEANSRYPNTRRAVRWMHARGRPVLGWGLGAPSIRGAFSLWRHRNRLAFLSSLDGLIAYSQRGAAEYRALGFPAGRVFVAHNAAAPKPKTPPPERPPGFNGQPAVLFVGRLQARKRVDHLLQACASLPNHMQPRLWIVGDGPARPDLEVLSRTVYPQAEFLGALHGPALDPLFAASDLFVLPGTGGLAIQQAMAHGLPVIVAQGDGTQEDLVREENGWLVPPGDLTALQDALRQALTDANRLRRMGTASYHIVAKEINLEAMVQAFVQAACAVLPESPAS